MIKTALFLTSVLVCVSTSALLVEKYTNSKLARAASCGPDLVQPGSTAIEAGIVLLGDSRIADWGIPSFNNNSQKSIVNLGSYGGTSAELLCQINAIKQALSADTFILQIGINDIVTASLLPPNARERLIQKTILNIRTIASSLSTPNSTLLLIEVPPPAKLDIARNLVWGGGIKEDVNRLNKALRQMQSDKIQVIGLEGVLLDQKGDVISKYVRDALHWNTEAYDKMTQTFKRHTQ